MHEASRILVVSHTFHPDTGSRAARLANFCGHLTRKGWSVHAFVPLGRGGGGEGLDGLLSEQVRGVEIHPSWPGPVYGFAARRARAVSGSGRKSPPRSLGGPFRMWLARRLLEPSLEWAVAGLPAFLQTLESVKPDIVFCSSQPFASQLLCLAARRLGRRFRWVGDFGDPLVGGGGLAPVPFWKDLWLGVESAVLKEMDHLCVTTPKTRRLYLDRYPFFSQDRITVVRNGYDPHQFRVQGHPAPPFRMTYAGSIYYPRVAVAPFLEALHRLRSADPARWEKARVRVVGPVMPQAAGAFREAGVELPGEVTFGESLREMAEAHILLLWGNDAGIQIPGKVYYYVGSRRPILCMVNSPDDDLADLLKPYPLAKIAVNEPEAIATALAELRPIADDQSTEVAGEEFVRECAWQGRFEILDGILAGLGPAP